MRVHAWALYSLQTSARGFGEQDYDFKAGQSGSIAQMLCKYWWTQVRGCPSHALMQSST